MTVSMRVMSAGDGYKYLLRTVAAGDGIRSLSTPLTRYYSADGTPPGRWMGSGVTALAGGIREGDLVTEPQLQLLIGMGHDPSTGEPLGRAYPQYGPDEASGVRRRAVAGYDFTFSIPKSASVLWGVADAQTQTLIVQAHHRAVADVVAYIEREVAATRMGATGSDGAVAQVGVRGVVATAFDHFDSRAGDPHLHTHVVISNKVKTTLDAKWRSLDGRPLHAAVVALSELHEALFADALTRALGVEWEPRDRGRDRNPTWAIAGVPEVFVSEFSTRAHAIDDETDRMIDAFVMAHGHRPDPATIMKLRAQATLATRPEKDLHSLAELTAGWRERASLLLNHDATEWAREIARNRVPQLLRAEQIPLETITTLGASVMGVVAEKRTTWRRWNLVAEAARQTMPYRFAMASDREVIVELVADAAEAVSLRLTPPELAESPVEFQRADGASVFRARHGAVFSATILLDAEDRLLDRSRNTTAPCVETTWSARGRAGAGSLALAAEQIATLDAIAGSRRAVDLLVGPAGTGKTTAMRALRVAWESTHGTGSVIGLAPSAAAAHVLAEDLGIATENTAKWWQNHLVHGDSFDAGQLVIIDEASLAGTLSLDRITGLAVDAGAKVLLVGDHAQLQAVEAGGAFALLAHDREDIPELTDVHRFLHLWEKAASVRLRDGDTEVVDVYMDQGRVAEGETEAMIDAAYVAWRRDTQRGKSSILVTDSNEAVAALNVRARAERILNGEITGTQEARLRAGNRAAAGDLIITRRNDRTLRTRRSWVRNGDRWTVVGVSEAGLMRVRRAGYRRGAIVTLPADYVAEHVDLGYAITSHRAQGITTDTAHVLVERGMTRENLYVAMTRGREANVAYVALDRTDASHVGPHPGEPDVATAHSVLHGVLKNVGAELSAHEAIVAEQDRWGSIAQLAAEYETIAAAAQHDRWIALLESSALTAAQVETVIDAESFGPLTSELRRVEAFGRDVDVLLPALIRSRDVSDADDIGAVLISRLEKATQREADRRLGRRAPRLIAGLVPEALGTMAPEMRRGLDERRALLERRATELVDIALRGSAEWLRELGTLPPESDQASWRRRARVVAAYRERHGVTGPSAVGPVPENIAQQRDHARAGLAADSARRLARTRGAEGERSRRSLQPEALDR